MVESLEPVLQLPSKVVVGTIFAGTVVAETATALDPAEAIPISRVAGAALVWILFASTVVTETTIALDIVEAIVTSRVQLNEPIVSCTSSRRLTFFFSSPSIMRKHIERRILQMIAAVFAKISAGVIVAITATALAVAEAMFTSRVAGVFVQLGESVLARKIFAGKIVAIVTTALKVVSASRACQGAGVIIPGGGFASELFENLFAIGDCLECANS